MESNFQSLPQDEQVIQIQLPHSIDSQKCTGEEKSKLRCVWENREKIISILIIAYLLLLIFNLMTSKGSLFSFSTENYPKNQITSAEIERRLGLEGFSALLADGKEKELSPASLKTAETTENSDVRQLQISTGIKVEEKGNQIKQNEHKKSSNAAQTKETPASTTSDPSIPISANQFPTNLQNILNQARSQREKKRSDEKYKQFVNIYADIKLQLHKTVHAISSDEREPIIASYFQDKTQKWRIEPLLKENYLLQPSRTKTDLAQLQYLSEEYLLNKAGEEVRSICAILHTHNNAYNNQITRTLNSLLNQHYNNYQIVIADSSSSDNTITMINQHLQQNKYSDRVKVMEYDSESPSYVVLSAVEQCQQDSLVIILDGNTELIGKQVFSVIASEQRESDAAVLYSDHYKLDVDTHRLSLFSAVNYDQSEKFMPLYRNIPKRFGRIFVAEQSIVSSIRFIYTRSNEGYFYYSGLDSILVSLLERSCGKITVINEPLGLSFYSSVIEQQQKGERMHELAIISMKKKLDIC